MALTQILKYAPCSQSRTTWVNGLPHAYDDTDTKQVFRVKNSWGLLPHALESLAKHWSVSAQLNIH